MSLELGCLIPFCNEIPFFWLSMLSIFLFVENSLYGRIISEINAMFFLFLFSWYRWCGWCQTMVKNNYQRLMPKTSTWKTVLREQLNNFVFIFVYQYNNQNIMKKTNGNNIIDKVWKVLRVTCLVLAWVTKHNENKWTR